MRALRGDIELLVCAISLVVSTVGFLVAAYGLIVIGLVCGGVSFGLRLGRIRDENDLADSRRSSERLPLSLASPPAKTEERETP
jgi:hypothetical protein